MSYLVFYAKNCVHNVEEFDNKEDANDFAKAMDICAVCGESAKNCGWNYNWSNYIVKGSIIKRFSGAYDNLSKKSKKSSQGPLRAKLKAPKKT
jgi:hypothetical protein